MTLSPGMTRRGAAGPRGDGAAWGVLLAALLALMALSVPLQGHAAERLADYVDSLVAGELVPGAERLGPLNGSPPVAPAFEGERQTGIVFLASDFTEFDGLFRQADPHRGRHGHAGPGDGAATTET